MAATGVTLMTKNKMPAVIHEPPRAGSVFVDFLAHVYLDRPATLPLDDIFRVCEVTIAADEAAQEGRVVQIGKAIS
jgi:hypothetical protein